MIYDLGLIRYKSLSLLNPSYWLTFDQLRIRKSSNYCVRDVKLILNSTLQIWDIRDRLGRWWYKLAHDSACKSEPQQCEDHGEWWHGWYHLHGHPTDIQSGRWANLVHVVKIGWPRCSHPNLNCNAPKSPTWDAEYILAICFAIIEFFLTISRIF